MSALLASLNPVRIVDEATDRLGALLIDGVHSLGHLIRHLATLPAGFQVAIALGVVVMVGVCTLFTLRAFKDARAIWSRFRRASAESAQAKADLATLDRRKALGYILLLGVLVCLAVLVMFMYHSWQGPPPPRGFGGR